MLRLCENIQFKFQFYYFKLPAFIYSLFLIQLLSLPISAAMFFLAFVVLGYTYSAARTEGLVQENFYVDFQAEEGEKT